MSEEAAPPGRTGRSKREAMGEAPPSERQPEEEQELDESEAEPSVTEGILWSNVRGREIWHAFNEDHDLIGTIYRASQPGANGKRAWHVKVDRVDLPTTHTSAISARAFLSGYAYRAIHDQHDAEVGA